MFISHITHNAIGIGTVTQHNIQVMGTEIKKTMIVNSRIIIFIPRRYYKTGNCVSNPVTIIELPDVYPLLMSNET